MENVRLLPWCASPPDISPIEKVWLPRDWLITIHQSLRLMNCGIVLKLHGHLYLYIPSNLCLTQCRGVQVLLLLPEFSCL
ncbi:UNVERIFIED_CONTAM: hypothetical protein NCL1_05103 [Trichonephila clavipes]